MAFTSTPGSQYPSNEVTIKTASGPVSYDLGLQETRVVELDPMVHKIDPAMPGAPILGLMNRCGAPKTVRQPVYTILRERQFPRFINAAGAWSVGDSTLTLSATDVGKIKRNYYILNTVTRVCYLVSGTPAANCPVTVAGEVPDTASDGAADELLILGYRGAEFDTRFVDFVRLPDVWFNYVGEYQTGYEITQYQQSSAHVAGHDPLARLRQQKLEELRLTVELGIMFDTREKAIRTDADGTKRVVWRTGGADSFITLNEADVSGGLTEAVLMTEFRKLRRHNASAKPSNERWALAAPQVMEKIDGLYVGDRRLSQAVPNKAGMSISRIEYGGLAINFVEQPLYDDASSTHANSLKGTCWIFNLDDLGLTTLSGESVGFFKWFMNVQTPGTRGRADQLVANVGVKMALPETHGRWVGF